MTIEKRDIVSLTNKIICGDSLQVLKEIPDESINLVITTQYIPFHIMSMEFLNKVKAVSKDSGVMVINTCNSHPSFYSHLHTIFQSLGDKLYRADGPNNKLSSVIFAVKGNFHTDNLDKIVMNDKILGAKIFTMKNIQTV